MKIILLPGLDGTGLLFKDLIANFPEDIDIEVISYEFVEGLSFLDQAEEIAERLDDMEFFLVGESYSGRVAYELSQILGERVKGIVFIASFISCPSVIASSAAYIPIGLLKPNPFSKILLNVFGFNLKAKSILIDQVFASIDSTNKRRLTSRLRNIASLTKPQKTISCPVTYIRPTTDLLVSARAVEYLRSRCTSFTQIKVAGGHFIAQSNPTECAKAICNALYM